MFVSVISAITLSYWLWSLTVFRLQMKKWSLQLHMHLVCIMSVYDKFDSSNEVVVLPNKGKICITLMVICNLHWCAYCSAVYMCITILFISAFCINSTANACCLLICIAVNLTGNVAVGNLSKMLPFVLKDIETQPKRQYLLLHSLKEVGCVVNHDSSVLFVGCVN
jgi:hypothetical protein